MSSNGRFQEISWGLRDLDWRIGTGYPGRLVVIGARPSCGKSAMVLHWVNHIEATHLDIENTVLCFWSEHTQEVAYTNWACLRLGYDLDTVLKKRWAELPSVAMGADGIALTPEGDLLAPEAAVAHQVSYLRQMTGVTFSPIQRPTITQIVQSVEEQRPRILVLDYLQRVKPEGRQTKFDAISEAAVISRELAISRDMLVVVTSQLHRKGDGVFDKYRPPFLEDFKGAGEIEEAANIALGLFRPLKKMTHKEEKAVKSGEADLDQWQIPGCMAIKVLKHHYWPHAADRIVRAKVEHGRITDWPREGIQIHAPLDTGDAWEPEQQEVPF